MHDICIFTFVRNKLLDSPVWSGRAHFSDGRHCLTRNRELSLEDNNNVELQPSLLDTQLLSSASV